MELELSFSSSLVNHCLWVSPNVCALVDLYPQEVTVLGLLYISSLLGKSSWCFFFLSMFCYRSFEHQCISSFISKFDNFRMTFLVAEACLIAGATKNAYHTKYLSAQAFSCESLRKGIFIAGAVFTVATMILNVYYYFHFTKSVSSPPTHKANRSGSNIGMAGGYA